MNNKVLWQNINIFWINSIKKIIKFICNIKI
jgi:hypothetical protein